MKGMWRVEMGGLYVKTHASILRMAMAEDSERDWRGELQGIIDEARQELLKLSLRARRFAQDDLCAQIEQRALATAAPRQRSILWTALKRLEAIDLGDT